MTQYYRNPVALPSHIELKYNEQTHTATIIGRKGSWTFKAYSILEFKGLDTCLMVSAVHPNGLVLISAKDSIPRFYSWTKLFTGNTIFNDCVHYTGWMTVK